MTTGPALDGLRRALKRAIPGRYRPSNRIVAALRAKSRGLVLSGPFRGMSVTDRHYLPELLGVYEKELHGVVEQICRAEPDRVVNIGAAMGYYAVGLARRLPRARFVAYEMIPELRGRIRWLAERNGVDERLRVEGACDPGRLNDLDRPIRGESAPVVICDVEGYERELLDPESVPLLGRSMILVEIHGDGTRDCLARRFADSHAIEHIDPVPRTRADLPYLPWYGVFSDFSYLLAERRDMGGWSWMVPREPSAGDLEGPGRIAAESDRGSARERRQ